MDASMEEECQRDRFDLDNDFEGGQFIGDEFFYKKKRTKRQQTEEDRLYGVFADGTDSDDDYKPRKKERADYSAPVSFVSKGTTGGPDKPASEAQQPTTAPPGAGLGSGANRPASGGLGFTSAGPAKQDTAEDDEEEQSVLPTAFGQRIKAKAAKRRQEEQQQQKQETQRQTTRQADPEFATFERHTKGIGMKLLQKMGYKPGEGLGREKTGIAKPVEAKMRPKKVGMGFGVRHYDSDEEAAKPPPAQASQAQAAPAQPKATWRKKHKEARVHREYKSAAEVLSSAPSKPLAAQPILDMRGPQARLITNLEQLNVKSEEESAKVPMPELQHNLQLLVDMAEADIQKLDSKLRHEQDTATLLAREKQRLQDEELLQAEQLNRLEEVLQEVDRCSALPGDPNALSLQQVEAVYTSLLKRYREEYVLYNLASSALSHALPRLSAALQGWSPLAEPHRCAADFRRWRPLLEPSGHTAGGGAGSKGGVGTALFAASGAFGTMDGSIEDQDPYLLLVSEAVLPPLRAACTTWEPRDPEALLSFLETWEPVLPRAALQHILDMLVMPRLRAAVTQWEPRQETVPIHAWLHPWLPFLGTALEELYPVIRHKLGVALQAWHPSDSSALILLRPWHRVFDAAEWDALLLRCIVPKLAMVLQTFVVNPVAQDMAPFNWVMSWHEVLPHHHTAALLDVGFFPKWHQVLHYWLSHTPNYDEVTAWYLGWKAAFPPGLLDHERVRRQFNAALDMMNTAVDGAMPPMPSAAPTSAFTSRWTAEPTEATASASAAAPGAGLAASKAAAAAMGMGSSSELTLRDLVQRFAEEYSIQFLPKFGRFQDGQQVYAFGKTSIVLDNVQSTIRALIRDRWAPVTLETLLQQSL